MRIRRVEFQSYKEDNERLLKYQEVKNQLNEIMLQSFTSIQRKINLKCHSENQEKSGSSSRMYSHKRSHCSRRDSRGKSYTP